MSPTVRPVDVAASVRVDSRTGIREQAMHLGPSPRRILALTHLPPGQAVGALLICSPVAAELRRNYRNEVLLSRALAARGIAVQRFHYRGSGHSDGEESALTWEAMLADSLTAVDHLIESTESPRLAFMGTRLAAPVAAAVAARHAEAPLVLWEPVVHPPDHFREVLRTRLVHQIRQTPGESGGRQSTADLLSQLMAAGSVEVLGFAIHRSVLESFREHNLVVDLRGAAPRRVLVVQVSRRRNLRRAYEELRGRLVREGFDVDTMILEGSEEWWFESEQVNSSGPDRGLVSATADWVVRSLTRAASR